jgi:hypothetical protein
VDRERDFITNVVVPLLNSALSHNDLKLESLEVTSKSSSGRKNKGKIATAEIVTAGRQFDYIATMRWLDLEIFFVEVARGIKGGNKTKSGWDMEKLLTVMKDSLDLYKETVKASKANFSRCTVYGMAIDG